MQPALLREEILRYEDMPDDEALLDEMIGLVETALAPDSPKSAQKNRKKTGRIVMDILFYGMLAALIAVAFFISRGDKKPIFGYSFMNVLTWSMEPEIPQGALVLVKKIDTNAIQIGDDITFTKDPETSITHRVIGITEDFQNSGKRGFETQGIANDTPDFDIVPAVNVAGKVMFRVPKLGGWLEWLREHLLITAGFAVGLLLLAILLRGAFQKSPKETPGKNEEPPKSARRKKRHKRKRNSVKRRK